MENQFVTPIQLRIYTYVIKENKWKILAIFLSALIIVVVGCILATPIYQASTQLLIKPGREDVYVSPTGAMPAVINRLRPEEKIKGEIAILTSLKLVMKLVDELGVNYLYGYPDHTLTSRLFKRNNKAKIPSLEKVHKAIMENLETSTIRESNVMKVIFNWPDPVIAAKVVNTLVELYLKYHLKVHTNPQMYDFLEIQAHQREKRLKDSENELENFKRQNSITKLPQQRALALEMLSQTEAGIKDTEMEIQQTVQRIAVLKAELSNLDRSVQLEERSNDNSSTLGVLKAKLADLELQGLKEEVKHMKRMIAEEESKEQKIIVSGRSPIHRNLEGELLSAKAQLEALKAKLRNLSNQQKIYGQELNRLNTLASAITELERKVKTDLASYRIYNAKYEEAKVLESMDIANIANVNVIEHAVPIMKPIRPRIIQSSIIGGFLGLIAGIGFVFLIEFVSPVFHAREDVERLTGLPVLVTLPQEESVKSNTLDNKKSMRLNPDIQRN